MDGDGVFDRIDHCVDTPAGCAVDRYGCSLDADGDGVCDGVDRCPGTPPGMKVDRHGCAGVESQRDTRSEAEPPREVEKERPKTPAPSAPASESERQLIESGQIRLENVYFETASARLLPESEASLDEAGQALEKFPDLRIDVEGHTDTRGSSRYNMSLSQARAEAVRDFLLARFKLRAEHLGAKGYGESRPETKERNEEELLRNRRVVLRVLNPDALPRGVTLDKKP
jgi:OOP family OmpA-OmpF porin